jgi:hypothetical protein
MSRTLLALAFVAWASVAWAPADTPQADLRLVARVGEPVRLERTFELDVVLELAQGKRKERLPLRYDSRLELVDELVSVDQPAAGDLEVLRTCVLWQDDMAKKPCEGELNGVKAKVTRRAGELGLELVGRLARESEMTRFFALWVPATGLALPETMAVGASAALQSVPLAALLTDQAVTSTQAQLTLAGVDADGLATLTGELLVAGHDPEDEAKKAVFEGACTLVVDTRAQAVRKLEWRGEVRLECTIEGVTGSGRGTFASGLSLSSGAPAREALARKILYRDVARTPGLGGLTLELPSHWYDLEPEEGALFRTSRHGDEALVSLELRAFPVEPDGHDKAIAEALVEIGKTRKLLGEKTATCPLGKGRSARFKVPAGEPGGPAEALVELYPFGPEQILLVRLLGPPKAIAEELESWPKITRSFGLPR